MKKSSSIGYSHAQLRDSISFNTRNFFQTLELSFLEIDPDIWISNDNYLQVKNIVHQLKVVKDTAEGGVTLMQKYNALLTKTNIRLSLHCRLFKNRKKYPDYKKSTLLGGLALSSSV